MRDHFAKRFMLSAIIASALLQSAMAHAAELPTYEMASYPVTQHQVAVLGSAAVEQQTPTSSLTRDGMPASAHQLTVLTPRHREIKEANSTIGMARQ